MGVKLAHYKDLKIGKYLNIDGEPCKVVDMQVSSTGKHGHAKARITAIGIFDSQKRQILAGMHQNCQIPILEKSSAQVVAVMGDRVQLMDLQSYETFEIPIPDEYKGKLSAGVEIEYQDYDGRKLVSRVKS